MEIHAVPQWQGALWDGAAARLPGGCRALAELAADVLGADVRQLPVEAGASPAVTGVGNRSVLVANRAAQLAALEAPDGAVLTIGGDCAVDLAPLGVARYRYGSDLTVAWFDAHADCNTAESSPSGAFHGMVLRSLLGEGDAEFAASPALERGRAVLVGTRAFDPAERQAVADGLVRHVPSHRSPAEVRDAVYAGGAGPLYLHVDLDVLDPAVFGGTYYHEPGGLTVDELCAALETFDGRDVVGAAVTECATTDAAELAVVTPILDVLGRLLTESSRYRPARRARLPSRSEPIASDDRRCAGPGAADTVTQTADTVTQTADTVTQTADTATGAARVSRPRGPVRPPARRSACGPRGREPSS